MPFSVVSRYSCKKIPETLMLTGFLQNNDKIQAITSVTIALKSFLMTCYGNRVVGKNTITWGSWRQWRQESLLRRHSTKIVALKPIILWRMFSTKNSQEAKTNSVCSKSQAQNNPHSIRDEQNTTRHGKTFISLHGRTLQQTFTITGPHTDASHSMSGHNSANMNARLRETGIYNHAFSDYSH